MKLKEYQEHALQEVKIYLEQLALWRGKMFVDGEWLGDFAEKAWEKAEVGRSYVKRKDGAGRPLPTFCLKIPTGGGQITSNIDQNIHLTDFLRSRLLQDN